MALVLIPEGGLHSSRQVTQHQHISHQDNQPSSKSLQFNRHGAFESTNKFLLTRDFAQTPNSYTTHEHSYRHFTKLQLVPVWHTGLRFTVLKKNEMI